MYNFIAETALFISLLYFWANKEVIISSDLWLILGVIFTVISALLAYAMIIISLIPVFFSCCDDMNVEDEVFDNTPSTCGKTYYWYNSYFIFGFIDFSTKAMVEISFILTFINNVKYRDYSIFWFINIFMATKLMFYLFLGMKYCSVTTNGYCCRIDHNKNINSKLTRK